MFKMDSKFYKIKLVQGSLAIILSSLAACTPKMMIRSDPSEAQVFLNLPNGQKKEIGKTPFEIPYSDLENAVPLSPATGEMIPLLFEKKSYESLLVMVPSVRLGLSSASILAKMKTSQEATVSAQQLIQYLHNSQKFVNAGNFERAHAEVDTALTKYPEFIRAISMKASIYFIQNRLDESLTWYEKSLALDTSFEEAVRMIGEIKKRKGDIKNNTTSSSKEDVKKGGL